VSTLAQRNNRVGAMVLALALLMLGAAYAAVPLYQMFCRVTGFGGTPMRAEEAPRQTLAQTVRVRFDANVSSGLPWRFEPVQAKLETRIGEVVEAHYRATNLSDRTVTGTATFNVTPDIAAPFFNKMQCFCFTEQTLKAGETVDMPVTLFVDPAMLEDASAKGVHEITLSYTFYETQPKGSAR
jgi:cytochrome c oxidase assembly protein subunit 11